MKPDLTQQMQQERPARKTLKQWLFEYRLALIVAAVDLLIWIFAPAQAAPVMSNTWDYLIELMVIIIPVTVLMGLFEVWAPKQLIAKYLGHESGWKGILLAVLFGAAPTGPLYIAFPIAAMLLKNGASPLNIIILLNAWAAMKIPQLLVEANFLGPSFMLTRLALTLPVTILIGWLIQTGIKHSGGLDIELNGTESIS